MVRIPGARVAPTDERHRVTTLELFFDLVFVFAITQVSAFMASDPTLLGAMRGFVVIALLWWAWCSYAWLGNQARADEGAVRASMVLAMGAMFVVALAIPESFADRAGGISAPVLFAVSYAFVRAVHLGFYLIAAGSDMRLRLTILATSIPVGVAVALLVTGAVLGPPYQLPLWGLALLVDYAGIYLAKSDGWRVHSAAHFAERHGLIVIVALGESIIAVGLGVADAPLSWAVVVAAALGLGIAVCLWWLYFDVVALVAESVLAHKQGAERTRLARDSYTYLHFPMVAGIVFLAVGVKKVTSYVADTAHHDLTDALSLMPLLALYGGVIAYLLGHVAFRLRNVGTINVHRMVAVVVLVVLAAISTRMPALVALGLVAGVLVALVTYEAIRFAEARAKVRGVRHEETLVDG